MEKNSVDEVLSAIAERYGEHVARQGVEKADIGKTPTGVFPLDYTLGGGLPNGRISVIYGQESSGKSCVALKAIATYQRLHPDRPAALLDVEGHYDSVWARKFGVDTEKLILVSNAAYAEIYVDTLDALLNMEDIGIIVLDSLAAFSPKAEMEDSVEQSHMGRVSQIQSVMIRKTETKLNEIRGEDGYAPPVLILNQVRANFNRANKYSPEVKPPGCKNHRHAGVLLSKIHGAPVKELKSTAVPVMMECTFTVERAKFKTLNKGIKFKIVLEDHGKFKVGDIADEEGFILSQLDSMGLLVRQKRGGCVIDGKEYRTQKEFKDRLKEDIAFASTVKESIIEHRLKESVLT